MPTDLVALLVDTPSARVAVLDRADGKLPALRYAHDDPRVRRYCEDRRVFLSCNEISTSDIFWSRLAAGLNLQIPNSDDAETDADVTRVVVLDDLTANQRTLITLEKLECIYSRDNQAQQEATDVLLATLAAIDEVTLFVSFCGSSLPESVNWTIVNVRVRKRPPLGSIGVVAHQNQNQNQNQKDIVHGFTFWNLQFTDKQGEPPTIAPDVQLTGLEEALGIPPRTPSIAADIETGDVPREQESAEPRTIFQARLLPARPAVFHGRDKDVERLVTQAKLPCTAPLGIVGPGGIGKTTLALKVLHDPHICAHFGRQRFFVSCEGAMSPDDVLGQLAYKLGVQRSQGISLWAAVLEFLRAGPHNLLVLDNFESIWSPTDNVLREASEVFLAQLAVIDELTIIVTTRGKILPEGFTWSNADTTELDTLSSTAARQTFEDLTTIKPSILAAEPEHRALTALLKEVDFIPLAVTLLARLDDLPSRLLREWSEYFTEVLEADHHDGTRRELSVEVSIKISLAHLPRETAGISLRQLLSVCGQLLAGVFAEVLDHLRPSIPNLDEAAETLLRHSLVYAGGWNELRMLSPVRHYISHRLPMDNVTRSAVEAFYLSLNCRIPPRDRIAIDGLAIDREMPNTFSIIFSMLDRPTNDLRNAVLHFAAYCSVRGHQQQAFLEKCLSSADNCPLWKAHLLYQIGVSHCGNDYETAIGYFERAAELFAKLGDTHSEALTRLHITQLGGIDTSEKTQQVLSGAGLSYLCDIYALDKTLPPDVIEQRYRVARETCLQDEDYFHAAAASRQLAIMREQLGDSSGALQEYMTANTLAEQSCPNSGFLGAIKVNLAMMYIQQQDLVAAENLIIEAHAIFSFVDDDRISLARTLAVTSWLRLCQGRHDEAAAIMGEAVIKFRESGRGEAASLCDKVERYLQLMPPTSTAEDNVISQ